MAAHRRTDSRGGSQASARWSHRQARHDCAPTHGPNMMSRTGGLVSGKIGTDAPTGFLRLMPRGKGGNGAAGED